MMNDEHTCQKCKRTHVLRSGQYWCALCKRMNAKEWRAEQKKMPKKFERKDAENALKWKTREERLKEHYEAMPEGESKRKVYNNLIAAGIL